MTDILVDFLRSGPILVQRYHAHVVRMIQPLTILREGRKTIENLSRAADPLPLSSSEPLRILHVIPDLCLAGAEMKLYKLLAATNREQFAPTVISMRDGGELRGRIEALGIPVHSLGIRGLLPGPRSVNRLARLVRRIDPDLIHGWMYHGNLAAQFAAALSRKKAPVLWGVHQSLYGFAYEKWLTVLVIKLGALLSRAPRGIVYVSKTSACQHEAHGYNRERTLVFHQGFDTEKFAPSEEARFAVCQELGLPNDTLLIGMIGRYHPVKDHANFLKAAERVLKSRSEVRFILCGKGVDHNNPALRTLVEETQIRDRIHLMGERLDIQRIMPALDIAVSSSCSEGFPNVVGEAMSSGVPCVVTAVSDLPEIVGTTGRVVPPRDTAALASAIEEMIAMGPAGRKALGAAARARVIEHYSLESSVAQYEAVYEGMTAPARTDSLQSLSLSQARIDSLP
jgi:glycosyltransferase involved in cell wall biosynthesis